jgi:hypothetical protein
MGKQIRLKKQLSPAPMESPQVILLSTAELEEFTLRQGCLQRIGCEHLMVQEAYQSYVKRIGEKYGVKGQFTIDRRNGEIKIGGKKS